MILTTEYSRAMGRYSQHFPEWLFMILFAFGYKKVSEPNEGSFLIKGFLKRKFPRFSIITDHYRVNGSSFKLTTPLLIG